MQEPSVTSGGVWFKLFELVHWRYFYHTDYEPIVPVNKQETEQKSDLTRERRTLEPKGREQKTEQTRIRRRTEQK